MNWTSAGLSLLLVFPSALNAQRDTVWLHGTVVDRSTNAPVAGAYVTLETPWTVADSLGRFTLSPVVRGHLNLVITCPRPRGVWGETLDNVVVDVHPRLDTNFIVGVIGSKCNLPAFAERRLELSGFYAAVEGHPFFPDPDSAGQPIIWGGNKLGRYAAVSFTAAGRAQQVRWPTSSYCFRVRWIGTLTGPGAKIPPPPSTISFGSVAAFTFAVDSTISIEAAPAPSCQQR